MHKPDYLKYDGRHPEPPYTEENAIPAPPAPDDLVRRLRKVDPDEPGERTRWLRNPDGPEAADRIEADARKLADAVEALERSCVALDDWVNTYASEMCDPERVKEAIERISEGGTLWYIATVQKQNRAALAKIKGGRDE